MQGSPSGPPISLATLAQYDNPVPAEADIVIVGGGIIGMCTAWSLRNSGYSVALCEKGRVGGEQSSRNWGWVRQTGRDAAELPIMMESIALWQSLASETGDNNLLFSQQGVTYFAENENKLANYRAFVELARSHGLDSEILSQNEVKQKFPGYGRATVGALFTQSDGRVEPWGAVPALARACSAAGISISENCAVRNIETTDGAVSEIITEKGRIKTSRVLVAGGVWSSLLTRQAGVRFPQLSVTSYVARIDGVPELLEGNAADGGIGICKRLDGGYNVALTDYHQFAIGPDAFRFLLPFAKAAKHSFAENDFKLAAPTGFPDSWSTAKRWQSDDVSPFEKNRILNPPTDDAVLSRMKTRLQDRFEQINTVSISHAWAGQIDTTPDFVPILDESPVNGLYLATGFSGHGFGIGPAAGKIMADMMVGDAIRHDVSRFRFGRFGDGSKLQLGPM